MNEIAEEAMMNAIDWLSSEGVSQSKQDRISELSTENKKLRWDAEILKWKALNELYSTVSQMLRDQNAAYGKRVCYRAEALIRMCFKMNYIDRLTYRSLLHYMEIKALEYTVQENKENIRKNDSYNKVK